MKPLSRISILPWALISMFAAGPAPLAVTFPGAGVAADPSGRFLVEWRAASYANPRELLLTNIRDRTSVVLMEFRREVSVLWAPTGKHLAVTDRAQDGTSDVLVFKTTDPSRPLLASSAIERNRSLRPLVENAHASIEALVWSADGAIRLRVLDVGASAPGEGERLLELRVGGGVREVRR